MKPPKKSPKNILTEDSQSHHGHCQFSPIRRTGCCHQEGGGSAVDGSHGGEEGGGDKDDDDDKYHEGGGGEKAGALPSCCRPLLLWHCRSRRQLLHCSSHRWERRRCSPSPRGPPTMPGWYSNISLSECIHSAIWRGQG